MNLLNLTLAAHRRALQQGRLVPAERRDLEGYPMRWYDDDGVMTPVFDETRLSDAQEAEIREILEKMSGRTVQKDVYALVRAHMEAFGRFGLRADDVAAAVLVSKPSALKYLRALVEDDLVLIKEEANPRKGGSARKRYFWIGNQSEYGNEDAFIEGDGEEEATDALLRIRNDRGRRDRQDGTGIVHHGASAHAPQCPDRCIACKNAIQTSIEAGMRTAARQAGGTGFSVGLAERIAAREAAEEVVFTKLEAKNDLSPRRKVFRTLYNRDLARELSWIAA